MSPIFYSYAIWSNKRHFPVSSAPLKCLFHLLWWASGGMIAWIQLVCCAIQTKAYLPLGCSCIWSGGLQRLLQCCCWKTGTKNWCWQENKITPRFESVLVCGHAAEVKGLALVNNCRCCSSSTQHLTRARAPGRVCCCPFSLVPGCRCTAECAICCSPSTASCYSPCLLAPLCP